MSFESISPNMSLVLPGVGQTLGPQYAIDLNNSLTIIDGHNHTAGYGVPVPSSGLNINADLTMGNNNLINIRSLRMLPQSIISGPSDLDCLFVNGVDLYYNDGVGNHVRITQSGGVAGSPGSISNLTSPASATYVAGNQTFVWQSAANTPANMDNASVILRNLVANSFGLTLNPPNAMAANYNLTLPTLPPAQQIMTLDNSGNMSAPYTVGGGLEISANVIQIADDGVVTAKIADGSVTTPKIADGAVTQAKLAALPIGISSSSSTFSTSSTSYVDVTNLTTTITTTGRSVFIGICADQLNEAFIQATPAGAHFLFVQDGTVSISESFMSTPSGPSLAIPPSSFWIIHTPSAGTIVYKLQVKAQTQASPLVRVENVRLIAYEL